MAKWMQWVFAAAAVVLTQTALADAKTLIELSGGKPSAALASSWKKVKDGDYQFTLDPSKEIGKGTPVSAAAVKTTLEAKLTAFSAKVTDQGSNVVDVTFSGDEAKFLEEVAKTKIRPGGDVDLALASSTSEGSIRANPGNRGPKPGEVAANVLSAQPTMVTVRITDSNAPALKTGQRVKLKTDGSKLHSAQAIFFMPEKQEGDAWVPKTGSIINH